LIKAKRSLKVYNDRYTHEVTVKFSQQLFSHSQNKLYLVQCIWIIHFMVTFYVHTYCI